MPRRSQEPALKISRLAFLVLLAAGVASPVGAQASTGDGDGEGVRGVLEGGLRFTGIDGEGTFLVGGFAFLRVSPRFSFGGGGFLATDDVDQNVVAPAPNQVLDLGYGGAAVEFTPGDPDRPLNASFRLLAGAGNADLRDAVVGTRLAADNFFVLEPEVLARLRLAGPLAATAGLGYRAVFGVQDLGNVSDGDLGAFSLSLSLRLGPL